MIGHTVGSFTMMKLGGFTFSVNTAAYGELQRSTAYRWASQERFGQGEALQHTGPGTDSITLTGVVFPEYKGGTTQIDSMRAEGAKGVPLMLVGGGGSLMGRWVIESVDENQSVFAAKGVPRKQEYTVKLKRYFDEVANGLIATVVAAVAAPAEPKTGLAALADKAAGNIATAIKTATDAVGAVQAKVTEIGSIVGPTIATASQGIAATRALADQVKQVRDTAKNINSPAGIQSALNGIMAAASSAANLTAVASETAGALGVNITTTPGTDPALVGVATDCQCAFSRVAVTATGLYSDAADMAKGLLS